MTTVSNVEIYLHSAGSGLAIAYRDSREIVRAINEASRLQGRMIGRRCHCPVSSTAIRAAMKGACVTAAISKPIPQTANIDGSGLCRSEEHTSELQSRFDLV